MQGIVSKEIGLKKKKWQFQRNSDNNKYDKLMLGIEKHTTKVMDKDAIERGS